MNSWFIFQPHKTNISALPGKTPRDTKTHLNYYLTKQNQRMEHSIWLSAAYMLYIYFKHQRRRAQATYMPVKSSMQWMNVKQWYKIEHSPSLSRRQMLCHMGVVCCQAWILSQWILLLGYSAVRRNISWWEKILSFSCTAHCRILNALQSSCC